MKIDLHVHTKYSPDSISSIERIIKTAKRKGMDAVAITDHDTAKGWREALKVSKKLNFPVVLGEEIMTITDGRKTGEILGLFLNEEIKSREPMEVIDEIKSQGGVVVIPHPFDNQRIALKNIKKYLKFIDAIEAFNSKVNSKSANLKAFEFAVENKIGTTGGSDAHIWLNVGNAYTVANASDLESFRKAIKNGKTGAYGRMRPSYTKFFPKIAKIYKTIFLRS